MMRKTIKNILLLATILIVVQSFTDCGVTDKSERKEEILVNVTKSFEHYNRFDAFLEALMAESEIDWIFIKSIILKESHFDSLFVSTAGAAGLMQLMPRKGSYTSDNYRMYMKSRKQKRGKDGARKYMGKKDIEWAGRYVAELDSLKSIYKDSIQLLYLLDHRFDPLQNIKEGVSQYEKDYRFFRKRGHGRYTSKVLSLASYNAGIGGVVSDKRDRRWDHIPINRQTEHYIGHVEMIYRELQKENGKLTHENEWILKL